MKPSRKFSATVGNRSTDIDFKGPETLAKEFDQVHKMFDPNATHEDGSKGGISPENMQAGACTDINFGTRTVNDQIQEEVQDTGSMTQLISWFAKLLKQITGLSSWKSVPEKNMLQMSNQLDTHQGRLNGLDQKTDQTNQNVATNKSNIEKHENQLKSVEGRTGTLEVNTTDQKKNIDKLLVESDKNKAIMNSLSNFSTDFAKHKNSNDHDHLYYRKEELDGVPVKDVMEAIKPSSLLATIKKVDGAGSGLDADMVKGIDGSNFIRGSDPNGTRTDITNANLIVQSGFYYAENWENAPLKNGCILHIQASNSQQSFCSQYGEFFLRQKNGVWGQWQRVDFRAEKIIEREITKIKRIHFLDM